MAFPNTMPVSGAVLGRDENGEIDRGQHLSRFQGMPMAYFRKGTEMQGHRQRCVAGAGAGRRGAAIIVTGLALVIGAAFVMLIGVGSRSGRRRGQTGVADCGDRRQQDTQQGQQQQGAAQQVAMMAKFYSKTIHN